MIKSVTFFICKCGRYDSKTDTWTVVAPINSPRDAVGVCVLGDKLYAVGGYDGSMYRHDVEAYDPQTNEWTKVIHFAIMSCIVCMQNVVVLMVEFFYYAAACTQCVPKSDHIKQLLITFTILF